MQKPTQVGCFSSPSGRGAWHDLPCAYVLSRDDQFLDPGLQRLFADRTGGTLVELRSGHFSPVSHPGEVAAAVRGVLTRRRNGGAR